MARLHVVYDPHDRVSAPDGNWCRHTGASFAVIHLHDGIDNVDRISQSITSMLLTSIIETEPKG